MKVTVKTPARLHLGLIDLNGDLGRMFGGLGVGINHPNVVVEAQKAGSLSVTGKDTELAVPIVERFLTKYELPPKVQLHIAESIPAHIGLGSGTQLTLAISTALARLFKVQATLPQLAVSMGRVRRTSVGTTVFAKGGFVVDGGKNIKIPSSVPPLIYRQPIPNEWRFIVAVPNTEKGLSSHAENKAFDRLTPMSPEASGQMCRLVMLKLLPAIAEKDIEAFGDALTRVQVITGTYFAQAQGGVYSSQATAECIEFLKMTGAYGVGQSSWGPALYGVVKEEQAKKALAKVKGHLRSGVGGEAFIAKGNNRGATIKIEA